MWKLSAVGIARDDVERLSGAQLCVMSAFLGAVIVSIPVLALAYGWGQDAERARAVKAGAARWVSDPSTGGSRFEYLKGK